MRIGFGLTSSYVLKSFLRVAVLLFFAHRTAAPEGAAQKNLSLRLPKPSIAFFETEYDFGEVDQGTIVRCSFRFKNLGERALRITHIHSTCSCLQGSGPDTPVPPGGTGTVFVRLATGYDAVPFLYMLLVSSSDPLHPQVPLTVKGRVKNDIVWAPHQLFFGNILLPKVKHLQVTISSHAPEGISVENMRTNTRYFTARLKRRGTEEAEILVESEVNAPTGPLDDVLEVVFKGRELPLRIPLTAFFLAPFTLRPDYVMFGFVCPKQKKQARLTLACNLPGRLRIGKPVASANYIHASLRQLPAANMYELIANVVGPPEHGKFRHTISIPVKSPLQTVLNVPCFGYVEAESEVPSGQWLQQSGTHE